MKDIYELFLTEHRKKESNTQTTPATRMEAAQQHPLNYDGKQTTTSNNSDGKK